MRLKILFTTMIAALAFAGCSSEEDDPINKGDENTDDGYGYVAVNIVEPKSIGSRANGSDQFEDGTNAENGAKTGIFCVYNQAGTTMYNDPEPITLTDGGTPEAGNPYVEKIYKAVLVLDGVTEKPTEPLQIICILNAPSTLSVTKTTTLADLKQLINDYSASSAGAFIMTNSVYKNGETEVCGATVSIDETTGNLKNSAADAMYNPVEIYVERVVARIQAKSVNFNNQGATIPNTDKKLTIQVTGIEVANIAEKSYLFKNITDINYDTWSWNDPTNKRSYWETVPAVATPATETSLTFGNKSYTQIATDGFNIDEVTNDNFKEYVQPNTNSGQKTAILVTAQLMDGDNAADLAYIRGAYMTKDDAKKVVASYLQTQKSYVKLVDGTTDNYTSIVPDDLKWVNKTDDASITWLKDYEVVAQVNSGVTDLKKKNEAGDYVDATVDEINDYLKSESAKDIVARVYTDGKCYYYVNIDQTPVATDNGYTGDGKFEGVIRNHIYDLTLNSISGIGTPVFKPEDVIIPQTPTDETLWFLGARINVLKWRLVKQTVDFTGK